MRAPLDTLRELLISAVSELLDDPPRDPAEAAEVTTAYKAAADHLHLDWAKMVADGSQYERERLEQLLLRHADRLQLEGQGQAAHDLRQLIGGSGADVTALPCEHPNARATIPGKPMVCPDCGAEL